jgi:hypothetical protein
MPLTHNSLRVSLPRPQKRRAVDPFALECEVDDGLRFLGDHWERSYADMEWRGM